MYINLNSTVLGLYSNTTDGTGNFLGVYWPRSGTFKLISSFCTDSSKSINTVNALSFNQSPPACINSLLQSDDGRLIKYYVRLSAQNDTSGL